MSASAPTSARRHPFGVRLATLLLLALTPGCGLLTGVSEAPGKLLDAASGKSQPEPVDLVKVRLQASQLADDAIVQIGIACRLFAAQDPRPEAQLQAARWAFQYTARILSNHSHPQPGAALVNLLLFLGVQRILFEEHWVPEVYGEAARPMLLCFQQLQDDAVLAVERVFPVEQKDALRAVLLRWRQDNPDLGTAAKVEPPTLADLEEQGKTSEIPFVSDVFALLKVDAFGGLEPVAREFGQARELLERFFFFTQHLPHLLSLQLQLHTLEILSQPELHSILADTERLSRASESLAATAASLPAELTAQREGLVADLERVSEPLAALLAESRSTLEAGASTSASLKVTIEALDAFLAGFRKPTPEPGAAPLAPAEAAEPTEPAGKPFDVAEYGVAAEKIGIAARELEAAITGLDESLPRVREAVDVAAERADRSVDRAYGKALRLVLWSALIVGVVVLLVRGLSKRRG